MTSSTLEEDAMTFQKSHVTFTSSLLEASLTLA